MKLRPFRLSVLSLLAFSAPSWAASIYTSGHADIGFAYEGLNDPYNHFHAEGGIIDGVSVLDQEYDALDIIIRVPNTSATTGGSGAGFLGIAPTATYWKLEQTAGAAAADNAPFLGIATEDLEANDWLGVGNVKFALTAFSGPGQFAFYQSGELSPIWNSADGIDSTDVYSWVAVGAGAHDHGNYAFSAPGDYSVTITMSGTHRTDGLQSATETYTFQVVPEPSAAILGVMGALGLTLRRHRKRHAPALA